MKKTAINPVTIRGHLPNGLSSSNLSIGRLWIATNKVQDGSHGFNPKIPKQDFLGFRHRQLDKPVTMVLWSVETEGITQGCVSSDDDFIGAVKRLNTQENITIVVWGRTNNSAGADICGIVFDRKSKDLKVTMQSEDKIVLGESMLSFHKFMDGLSHLFPNGELG